MAPSNSKLIAELMNNSSTINTDAIPNGAGVAIGTVISHGETSPPAGFLSCDGSAISRTTYSELYAVISTTWGTGDGATTFNLPDLRGGFVRGAGSQTYTRTYDGGSVGTKTVDTIKDHGHRFRMENVGGPNYPQSRYTRGTATRGMFKNDNSQNPPVNPNEPSQASGNNLTFFGNMWVNGWIGGWNEYGLRIDRIDTDALALRDNAAGGVAGNDLTRGGQTFPFNATCLYCIKF
jgi:microcystin-dependent protein